MERTEIRSNFLKNTILGLFYPAVLGNILYLILLIISDFSFYISSNNFNLKFSFLIITSIFYLCDFFYIYFTPNYKRYMFFLDLIFIGVLFCTIHLLHIPVKNEVVLPISIQSIFLCYLAFIILYFFWDSFELKTTQNKEEKEILNLVIKWEYFSVGIICLSLFSLKYLDINNFIYALALAIITVLFALLTFFKKYKYWLKSEDEKQKQKNDY